MEEARKGLWGTVMTRQAIFSETKGGLQRKHSL